MTAPGQAAAPTDGLRACLDGQRAHVVGIPEGLDDDALRRPVLPSGWSCAGLVQHLAADVERFWFRAVVAGEPEVVEGFRTHPGDAWQLEPGVPAHSVLDRYRQEVAATDAVITETACHAGHLDAARELIDGRTWLVLP